MFLHEKLLIPGYCNYKKLNRIKFFNKLKKRDNLSIEELKNIQWRKLKKLINHCYSNIPYYTELFDKNGIHPDDIKNLKDYSKIPPITKNDMRENYDKLIDPSLPEHLMKYDSTSGSTGIPLKFIRSLDDQEYGFALRYRSNAWCGWNFHEKSAWFVSDSRHIMDVDKFKGKFRYWILNRLVLNTKNITPQEMEKWVYQLIAFKPKHIYGYSSLLAEFSKFVIENSIQLEGINGVYSTSEVLRDREIISKAFKAPVYDQYGASEVPCIAHECKKGNMHMNIDEVLVEFEDIATDSDIKKMIITPLYIYGMPLLRYDLQDAAIPTVKTCDCGLPYPVMELKVARISDNLHSPTGKLVSGVSLSWYITDATRNLDQYEVIQEEIDKFTLRLITPEQDKEFNEDQIRQLLYEMLETDKIIINFEYPDEILPGTNGKYRPISSKITGNFSRSV